MLHVVFLAFYGINISLILFCSVLQLQSLTLRPPPPGTLTIPPNLPLKATTSSQPPPLSCPRLQTFHLRPSQPANTPGKEGATKTESPTSQTAQTKATPVRHLTVPPPCKQPHAYLSLSILQIFESHLTCLKVSNIS